MYYEWKYCRVRDLISFFFDCSLSRCHGLLLTCSPCILTKLTYFSGSPVRNLLANIIGFLEVVLSIGLLVYVTAPISGGHINPSVTIATFFTRLTSFPRAVLYVFFQLLGGAIGAFLIRGSYGAKLPEDVSSSNHWL